MFRTLSILSLDVVAGALISSVFIGRLCEVQLPWPVLFCLGSAVWTIYTADHLADAVAIPHSAHTERHRFHQRHFWALFVCLVMSGISGAVVALSLLPDRTLLAGATLMAIVAAVYLCRSIFPRAAPWLKEPGTSILFTLGLFAGPLSLLQTLPPGMICPFLTFAGFALSNLLVFSRNELESDRLDHQTSLVMVLDQNLCRRLAGLFAVSGIVIAACMLVLPAPRLLTVPEFLVLATMGTVLRMLASAPRAAIAREGYRLLGDGVFLLPVLVLA